MRPGPAVTLGLARYQLKVWRAEDHPRDPRTGRFVRRIGGPTWRAERGLGRRRRGRQPQRRHLGPTVTAGELRVMTEDDLYRLYVDLLSVDSEAQINRAAYELVNAEIDRREKPPPDVSTPEQREIDRWVAAGYSYIDAHREVTTRAIEAAGGSEDDQRDALVDAGRQRGESRRQALQRNYREMVYLSYVAAENATRGNLLTKEGQSRGIDPITLFSGPSARARRYASEDLKRWWADNPPGRTTFTEYEAKVRPTARNRRAAERTRLNRNARDFGI